MTRVIEKITGRAVPLLLDDIDTDRIIPARYLRCVTFDGLHEHVFKDDRAQHDSHPFDDERHQGGAILVAGRNFGCGSSREHAPQALMRWGIQAIVAESFAEIFFGNCIALGIPAVCLPRPELEKLAALIQDDPTHEITVHLGDKQVHFGGQATDCHIPESAHSALVSGQWDFMSQLLEAKDEIRGTADKLPYLTNFA